MTTIVNNLADTLEQMAADFRGKRARVLMRAAKAIRMADEHSALLRRAERALAEVATPAADRYEDLIKLRHQVADLTGQLDGVRAYVALLESRMGGLAPGAGKDELPAWPGEKSD
jgi:ABC-type transporter Mla subunit MlaD